ncbi:MAG: hypothetical protein ACRC1J_09490 [Sandaracinobacteroides sp.]
MIVGLKAAASWPLLGRGKQQADEKVRALARALAATVDPEMGRSGGKRKSGGPPHRQGQVRLRAAMLTWGDKVPAE